MNEPTLCLIGAGRAGGSLARQWHAKSGFKTKALFSRSGNNTLASEISALNIRTLDQLPTTDAVLIATPDSAISPLAQLLAELPDRDWHEKVVFHLSGALPASCLKALADKGALIASAHPVRAFSNDHTCFKKTWVGIEGDKKAQTILQNAFNAIGGQCFCINSAQKIKYHAAAVIASNHMVALADAANTLWQDAGLEQHTSTALFESLALGVLDNLREQPPKQALTGPIARGDVDTVAKHVQALDADQANIALLYRQVSEHLLHLMQTQHSAETQQALRDALRTSPTPGAN